MLGVPPEVKLLDGVSSPAEESRFTPPAPFVWPDRFPIFQIDASELAHMTHQPCRLSKIVRSFAHRRPLMSLFRNPALHASALLAAVWLVVPGPSLAQGQGKSRTTGRPRSRRALAKTPRWASPGWLRGKPPPGSRARSRCAAAQGGDRQG